MAAPARDERFRRAQERRFATADADHFAWQVAGAGFAPLEAALLAPVARTFAAPYLEIGCGEGANFVHVGGSGLRIGLDRFADKLRFAAGRVPGVHFVASDAGALPLASARFRLVLVRDVLHHVPEPGRVVAEAARVLAPGGRLVVIEPNGANPMIALQARVVAAEAGLATSRRDTLRALLAAAAFTDVQVTTAQPFPLRRLVFHPRLGLPALGRVAGLVAGLGWIEAALGRMLGPERWSYLVLTARRT